MWKVEFSVGIYKNLRLVLGVVMSSFYFFVESLFKREYSFLFFLEDF